MPSCYTCTAPAHDFHFICTHCESASTLKDLRTHARSIHSTIDAGFEAVEGVLRGLQDQIADVAQILDWGFQELQWELTRQTEILVSIDQTLKTPAKTKANELRLDAEEFRHRGLLKEAKTYFQRSLAESPLDFRAHMGLALLCLQLGGDEVALAQKAFAESLPHAPSAEMKAYALRRSARVSASLDDFAGACTTVSEALNQSPANLRLHFDLAQYASKAGKTDVALTSLKTAVGGSPVFWYAAQKARRLAPIAGPAKSMMLELRECRRADAKRRIESVNVAIKNGVDSSNEVVKVFEPYGVTPRTIELQRDLNEKLQSLRRELASSEYRTLVNAQIQADTLHRHAERLPEITRIELNTLDSIKQQNRIEAQDRAKFFAIVFGIGGFFFVALILNMIFEEMPVMRPHTEESIAFVSGVAAGCVAAVIGFYWARQKAARVRPEQLRDVISRIQY